jgi:hypothetical protein
MLHGGGGGTLRWLGLAAYALLWTWLLFTLLVGGAWIAASVLTVTLLALWRLPSVLDGPRLCVIGGGAAVVAAVAWTAAPLLEAGGLGGDLSGSGAVTAALLLLPVLLAVREREAALSPSLGPVGFVLGFAFAFVGAVLGGGGLAPISGWLAQPSVWLGQMLLLAGTVPFAVVAAWGRFVSVPVACALVLGSGAELVVAAVDPRAARIPAILAAAVFSIGWIGVGIALLRPTVARGGDDLAAASGGD